MRACSARSARPDAGQRFRGFYLPQEEPALAVSGRQRPMPPASGSRLCFRLQSFASPQSGNIHPEVRGELFPYDVLGLLVDRLLTIARLFTIPVY